jgi:choline dehydrogenase-like flavoprotein
MTNVSDEEKRYDFIVVGAGAAGSVFAAESSASGAQVLVIESGGPDDAPTILNPSVWFYHVGGPLEGAYYLEWREGAKRVRLSVGKDPQDAAARRLRKEAELNAVNNGVAVVAENGQNGHRSLEAAVTEYL